MKSHSIALDKLLSSLGNSWRIVQCQGKLQQAQSNTLDDDEEICKNQEDFWVHIFFQHLNSSIQLAKSIVWYS